jgi:mannosidase alpha-like ER degradation enhancer 2
MRVCHVKHSACANASFLSYCSYSLTLIDALDTLAVMGNYTEFQRVVDIITRNANFDANINVSVFETNIRIIGGLLSAHLLSYR